MIHLHTGLPGAGKTLCTLAEVKARAEKEKRPVYYHGVTDLKLPWIELDKGELWSSKREDGQPFVPDGAIVLLDEAQRYYRVRAPGSPVPQHVSALETHRHRGLDIYLITQHPKLIDTNARRLVGRHVHFVRAFNANAVTRHEWHEVQEDPQSREDSIKTLVPYPVDAFQWYKSAEVHTHQRKIPRAVWFLLVLPILIGGLGYVAYRSLSGVVDRASGKAPTAVESAAKQGVAVVQGAGKSIKDYFAGLEPRIRGLPHTAPVYDGIVTPVRAPYPAACLATASRCKCYSQQATALDMPEDLCRSLAAKGFFRAWDDKPMDVGAAQTDAGKASVGSPRESGAFRLPGNPALMPKLSSSL